VGVIGHDGTGSTGRIVDRRNGDGDRGIGRAVGQAVVGFVSETIRTVVVERRGVGEAAVAVQTQYAVGGAVHEDRGERIAIDVAVIGEHTRGADCESGVFGCGVGVIGHDGAGGARRVVDRSDGDGHSGRIAVQLQVAGLISEGVESVIVAVRRVTKAAVIVKYQGAMSGRAHQYGAQSVAVHVTVVGQHAGRRHVQRRVLWRGVA